MALRSEFPSLPESHISLSFLEDLPEYDETKPYYFSGPLPEEQEELRTNIRYQTLNRIPLLNLRGQEHKLDVEKHGFEIIKVPESILRLDVRGAGRGEYMEKMAGAVKRRLNATFVVCYNYKVSVWRPLGVVHECDLLYGDFTTVAPTDLHAVDRASSEYVGEVYMLKPRSHYDWYWVDHQRPDEASIFISFDSHPASGAPYCPHTSKPKLGSNTTSSASPRESIELRLIVFSPAA
ncbi:hypothetical protein NEMBOFW57_007075 [Staphylotrichum longicolle]|uniref:Methyltransferase n=1 Tax=Staphylotrichum longicolle TaxID=669026 RepID=A0AAD4ETZ8_9PEZI|nr:hypothetical protein NEMBOFW57_007075 [Staphylotrichum longicolle]